MATKRPRWYVDSCIFIAHLKGETDLEDGLPRNQVAITILEKARLGEAEVVTSVYTIAEVNGGQKMAKDAQARRDATSLFLRSYIELIEVDRTIAERARQLIWDARSRNMKVKNDDMIHLASAIEDGCDAFLTWDGEHLLPCDNLFGIRVMKPEPGQLVMSFDT